MLLKSSWMARAALKMLAVVGTLFGVMATALADKPGASVSTDRGGTGQEDSPSAGGSEHWAYQPVTKPAVPAIDDEWIRSPIDAFILEKLQAAGIAAAPRADKRTILRRAFFDLTGLPPTYADLEEFERDEAPGAFARVVDRLLASPTYGQHWARHWLDVARYADTKGYVFTANPSYPYAYTYRDYVVDAFNEDVPYDQFVVEQIAADLVEKPRNDRTLAALGFLTVGRRFNNNNEDILDDRIDVITRGFLGLTVACARCHDHKYDPIPTADYYSLYGVLASCEEPSELPYVGDPAQHEGYERFQAELNRRRRKAEDYLSLQHALLSADLRHRAAEYLRIAGERVSGQGAEKTPSHIKPRILERWEEFLKEPARAESPIFGVWTALAKIPADHFAADAREVLEETVARAAAGEGDSPSPSLLVAAALLCDEPASLAEASQSMDRLFAAADSLWVLMEDGLLSAAQLPREVVENVEQALAVAWDAGNSQELRTRTLEHVLADLKALREFLYAEDSPVVIAERQVRRNLDVREKQHLERLFREVEQFEADSPDAPPRAMVVVDRDRPVEPVIFERGNPRRRGERVPRQFLAALSDEDRRPFQQGSGRLELARAIANASNPLTARVIVNRVWQHHFGEGIVRSASNFGVFGEAPSHPELLDWLAAEFVDHGWSMKWLHREIMRSAVYQQTSEVRNQRSEVGSQADPENRLLARQNRRRLDFEPLRDAMLAWAGRLDASLGGQPFKLGDHPSVPRRTIYGLIDRQHMYQPLRYFDVASPDASASDRPRTIVPQQALFLLNSPFMAEQARAFVGRLESTGARERTEKITALYKTVLLRQPAPEELARAEAFLLAEENEEASERSEGHLSRLEQLAQTLMVCNEAVFVD